MFILVLLMILLFGGVTFALKGDFNGDGNVTIVDAVFIFRALSEESESFSIQGVVRDENQSPLENVMITIDGIEAQDLSDSLSISFFLAGNRCIDFVLNHLHMKDIDCKWHNSFHTMQ